EVIEETKVFHGSFQLQTGEADTVNPATILSKRRKLTNNGAHVFAGTVEITSRRRSLHIRVGDTKSRHLSLGGILKHELRENHLIPSATSNTSLNGVHRSTGCRSSSVVSKRSSQLREDNRKLGRIQGNASSIDT